jgi:uncharacterized protein (TIGR03437 family)
MRALVPISSSGAAQPLLSAGHRGHPAPRLVPGTRAKCGLIQILILLCIFASNAHAVGTTFSTILAGSGQDIALAVTSDAQGNVYVAGLTYSPDFPVTPGAYQTTFGQTCDAFITKLGPNGQIVWSTYLGGILDDFATGVAVDSAGNVWVAGYTRSANFPLVNPIQDTLDGDNFAAFVAKLNPAGSTLLYSTFLGGAALSGAAGLALDAAGNAYVAVNVDSATGYPGTQNAPNQYGIVATKLNPQGALVYSFFHPTGTAEGIAVDAAGSAYLTGTNGTIFSNGPSTTQQVFGESGPSQAMVFKISSDGSTKIYETTFGGSVQTVGAEIAVDRAGDAYIAGTTSSADFPLVKPLQSSTGARPLWQSSDGGNTWTPMDNLPFALPQVTVVDPTTPTTVYQATGDLGVFKSLDGGATWTGSNSGIAGTNVQTLAIDPVHPQTLYAATVAANGTNASAVYKTVNGATSWTLIDSPALAIPQLAVDAQNPNIVWEIGASLRKSTDAGATWNPVAFPGTVASMVLDPRVSGNLLAISNPVFCGPFCGSGQPAYLYRSTNGGTNWTQEALPSPNGSLVLVVDGSTNPSTVYDDLAYRSVDGGVTWAAITPPGGTASSYSAVAVDPGGTLYAAIDDVGNYVSRDHAQTWTAIGSFIPPPTSADAAAPAITSLVPAGSTGMLYATINQLATAGFVTKLSADGSSIVYSTYLRGHASMESFVNVLAEPGVFQTQNWISAIALDAAGNITVAGGTRAVDFPTANAAQPASAGLSDAFIATISADGSKLNDSTYFGGSQDDGALAVALDSQGNAIFAGQTWSGDFPVPGGEQLPYTYGNAFVVRLAAPGPPVITSVLNGASFLPAIEAGSWVTIQGTNLANAYPGQTWTTADFVGNNLPTQLAGVSVTIDGKPAFVEYVSPTQINVQAPSDMTTGTVNVIVTNNGQASAPWMAQLLAVAPAFFMSGTSAIASILPGYTPVSATAPAMAGDLVVLWGTGFGPTTPPVPAGMIVTGAPVTSTLPVVTIGGVQVPVISSVLTTGTAGLYQITIQLPATVPTGTPAVEASIGRVQTQSGMTLFVGAQ